MYVKKSLTIPRADATSEPEEPAIDSGGERASQCCRIRCPCMRSEAAFAWFNATLCAGG